MCFKLGVTVRTTILASIYKKVSGTRQTSLKKIPLNVNIYSKIEKILMEMTTDLHP